MNVEVVMPKMGESIQEGKVLRWVKKVGDMIERDEVLLEISTDKVDTEVPSPTSGKIVELLANENDTVEVGKVIAVISTDVSAESSPKPAESNVGIPQPESVKEAAPTPQPVKEAAPTPQPVKETVSSPQPVKDSALHEVLMPKMGESIQEGKVLKWVKKVGDSVERDEVLLEISTDKVDTEVPSPINGTLQKILANEGDVVEVGKPIAMIASATGSSQTPASEAPKEDASVPPASQPAAKSSEQSGGTNGVTVDVADAKTSSIPRVSDGRFYSPLVRSIAAAENVTVDELNAVKGTGIEGRVTKKDILNYLTSRTSSPVSRTAAPAPGVAVPLPSPASVQAPIQATAALAPSNLPVGADDEVIPMDRVRQLIAEHMVRSKLTSPHVTSVAEADVTGIVKLREKMKEAFQQREGFKLTYTPFFGIACVDGVKQFPMINVSVDGKNIILHRKVHLGMATATPDGNLIVPVIKNADVLNVTGMARYMNDLAQRARIKKLTPDDISGGTITITNVGSFGSLFGSPVINQPQCAIMGIGAIQKRPVVRTINGEDLIVVRSMVYLSLTYDHRVVDGALATQALAAMCKSLEAMSEETVSL
ncbi:MAG: 2-oxoglutarate dehydrogenase, E2 component, dihydrolipoamide succinyltransferase [Ignavibacteria bacterium]|nr:2-oxoglutarate dehydrogenase, E2 component, dihydrolipoamide succinyltransferase [Ignavibacteria bacterium]